MRCKMHMYEYNDSSTKVAQDIQGRSGELNNKMEDTVQSHVRFSYLHIIDVQH
jgi:hypothetical protein